jgi:molybdate transport system substrate-binding protein
VATARRLPILLLALVALAVATLTMSCAAAPATSDVAPAATSTVRTAPPLTVFAAASLNHVFPAMAKKFKATHPAYSGLVFAFNFQASDTLAAQVEQGAPADIFAGASTKYGDKLYQAGLIHATRLFCQNRCVVIMPASNPGGVTTLGDLTKPGLQIAIGAAAAPIGTYTREVLQRIQDSDVYGSEYYDQVMDNVVINCANVSSVVALVLIGEVDAGFVYRSDWKYVQDRVTNIPIALAYQSNPLPMYPIARAVDAKRPLAARAFIRFVMGDTGQRMLKDHGFLPKP